MWAFTKNLKRKIKEDRGATIIIVAVSLLALLGFLALAIDVGYIYGTRNELQNVADAGALAGARKLGDIYAKMPYQLQINFNCETASGGATCADIKAYVEETTKKNKVAGDPYNIDLNDIEIGQWDFKLKQFTKTNDQPDAVMVTARRDQNKVSTFFGKVLGVNEFTGIKVAVAALSGPSKVSEGELKTPIGLSMNNFPSNCKDLIELSPTKSSCAGWHNFFDPHNANAMGQKSLDLIAGHPDGPAWLDKYFDINKTPAGTQTPETEAGDSFDFNGGTVSSLFLGGTIVWTGPERNVTDGTVIGNNKQPAPFIALFDFFRMRDGDGDDSIWTATIPVYKDENSCTNPNGLTEIVGFAKIEVIMPCPPPGVGCDSSTVKVKVDCNFSVVEGRGGGVQYGNLKGSIPGLVK